MGGSTHCLPPCSPRRQGCLGRRRPSTRARCCRRSWVQRVERACRLSGPSAASAVTWAGWSPSLARPRCRISGRPRWSADTASRDTFHQATGVSLLVHLTCKENQVRHQSIYCVAIDPIGNFSSCFPPPQTRSYCGSNSVDKLKSILHFVRKVPTELCLRETDLSLIREIPENISACLAFF